MKNAGINRELLHLLVSIYNQSIQTYYYFPEVILCGRTRMDRERFEQLLSAGFVAVYKADSFGQYYRLTQKGEAYLLHASFRRRYKQPQHLPPLHQQRFSFTDQGLP